MRDRLIISFCICQVITFVYTAVFDQLPVFLFTMVLHTLTFFVMACMAFVLGKLGIMLNARHFMGLLGSTAALLAILWKINGGELGNFLSDFLSGEGVFQVIGTFVLANAASVLLTKKWHPKY
jgi:hypothetical protein